MQRVHLSIEDQLFESLDGTAKQNNETVNDLIINILKGIYYDHVPFNFSEALSKLTKETEALPNGKEFVLSELRSFSEICVAKADKAYVQPATIRARLGKDFNKAVREDEILRGYVKRAKTQDKNGNSVFKFISRSAVYVIDKSVVEIEKVEAN